MMEELIKKLSARYVTVKLEAFPRYYPTRGEPIESYKPEILVRATVESTHMGSVRYGDKSWPAFSFQVSGRSFDEVGALIERRLDLVEPVIAASVLRHEHKRAVDYAAKIGEKLADCVNGPPSTSATLRVKADTTP